VRVRTVARFTRTCLGGAQCRRTQGVGVAFNTDTDQPCYSWSRIRISYRQVRSLRRMRSEQRAEESRRCVGVKGRQTVLFPRRRMDPPAMGRPHASIDGRVEEPSPSTATRIADRPPPPAAVVHPVSTGTDRVLHVRAGGRREHTCALVSAARGGVRVRCDLVPVV